MDSTEKQKKRLQENTKVFIAPELKHKLSKDGHTAEEIADFCVITEEGTITKDDDLQNTYKSDL